MPEQPMDPRPHFVLTGTAKPEHFRSTRSPRSKSPPNLDRQVGHGPEQETVPLREMRQRPMTPEAGAHWIADDLPCGGQDREDLWVDDRQDDNLEGGPEDRKGALVCPGSGGRRPGRSGRNGNLHLTTTLPKSLEKHPNQNSKMAETRSFSGIRKEQAFAIQTTCVMDVVTETREES